MYLHALANASRPGGVVATTLSPIEIRDAWVAHINRMIWVSNARARGLLDRGMLPPRDEPGIGKSRSPDD